MSSSAGARISGCRSDERRPEDRAISRGYGDKPIPRAGEGKRGEDGYLGYLLRQAAGAYRQRMEKALADLGVTQPQFAVMTLLNAYPGASNADLARVALLTPQTLSVIIANLEKAGIVAKRSHAVYERVRHIELTPSGHALHVAARKRVRVLEAELVAGFSEAEQRIIRRWLVQVTTG